MPPATAVMTPMTTPMIGSPVTAIALAAPIAQNTDNPGASNQTRTSDSLVINRTAKKVTTAALPFIQIMRGVK